MQISLSSGRYDIVKSGYTFLDDEANNLQIDFLADNGFAFSVLLKFIQDASERRGVQVSTTDNMIKLSCNNFKDDGEGLVSPLKVAVIDGRALYLMFWSYVEGNEARHRIVKYTLFHEK